MSIADELEKLDQLRARGVISNEEFEREKAKVLGSTTTQASASGPPNEGSEPPREIPFYRKPLFLLIAFVFFPAAVLPVIWTGPIYRKDNPAKEYVPFSLGWKIFFSVFAVFWLIKWIAFVFGT